MRDDCTYRGVCEAEAGGTRPADRGCTELHGLAADHDLAEARPRGAQLLVPGDRDLHIEDAVVCVDLHLPPPTPTIFYSLKTHHSFTSAFHYTYTSKDNLDIIASAIQDESVFFFINALFDCVR